MGDVNYNDKVDNKGGVVAGNIFGSSPGAVNITGTTVSGYQINLEDTN